MTEKTELAHIGVVGLAVMGSNLARNFAHNGNTVAVYNRSPEKTHKLIEEPHSLFPSMSLQRSVCQMRSQVYLDALISV